MGGAGVGLWVWWPWIGGTEERRYPPCLQETTRSLQDCDSSAQNYERTGPVDLRTTSSGSNRSSSLETGVPPTWLRSWATAACPIASMGWRTVVSGGSLAIMSGEASKPTTEMSPGTRRPARRARRITPTAGTTLAQTAAVTSRFINPVARADPPT